MCFADPNFKAEKGYEGYYQVAKSLQDRVGRGPMSPVALVDFEPSNCLGRKRFKCTAVFAVYVNLRLRIPTS